MSPGISDCFGADNDGDGWYFMQSACLEDHPHFRIFARTILLFHLHPSNRFCLFVRHSICSCIAQSFALWGQDGFWFTGQQHVLFSFASLHELRKVFRVVSPGSDLQAATKQQHGQVCISLPFLSTHVQGSACHDPSVFLSDAGGHVAAFDHRHPLVGHVCDEQIRGQLWCDAPGQACRDQGSTCDRALVWIRRFHGSTSRADVHEHDHVRVQLPETMTSGRPANF
mmetsp:Transcript_3352/g.20922  ORF Transcript_3352/g.20922 Transcript_3352/m.20922 type:complete len:226 (-) Transcript_3352:107-784(-)